MKPSKRGECFTCISPENRILALIGAASFYLILQKLNKRYSGEQEIASKKSYLYI
jgi:hypothetical protein